MIDRINTSLPNHNFEFIIATSEYMYRKPNKRIFELALEKAQLCAEDVWYIGDNYECDVVGARNAGIFRKKKEILYSKDSGDHGMEITLFFA